MSGDGISLSLSLSLSLPLSLSLTLLHSLAAADAKPNLELHAARLNRQKGGGWPRRERSCGLGTGLWVTLAHHEKYNGALLLARCVGALVEMDSREKGSVRGEGRRAEASSAAGAQPPHTLLDQALQMSRCERMLENTCLE